MHTYTFFNREGRVIHFISGPFRYAIAPTLAEWDGYHYEGEYDNTYYFHDGEPIKRPASPVELDGLVLKNVPANSVIEIDGTQYNVLEAQDVTLQFPFEGTYHVIVIPPFPYLEKEFTIDYQP